ncbi:MAG: His/Gly/Thr/Pro-type tRNA ligase C-terminal domain-containing protein, partial [Lutibacter sp.]|nr:His/Gly/Thr/Pro-type tRNA ligase C-terminal domain-containing protein [Lutibacter sp.]
KQEYVWATSWGVSTRLIGALIMTHSDDLGLVLPPNLAPIQVVIIPIHKTDEQLDAISVKINEIVAELRKKGISVKYDDRTAYKPGWKFAEYELKGVPLRIAMGPNDLENGTLEIARRDTLEKQNIPQDTVVEYVEKTLKEIQDNLYQKALNYRETHITEVNSLEEFKEVLEIKGGFISAHWDGTPETEEKIKDLTKATIRCIPLNNKIEEGKCVFTGEKSTQRVLFAKAY